jgi:hypothetical protein
MKHLKLVNENYFKHMLEAWLVVVTFIGAGNICFVHSIFPFLFKTTASTMVKNIIKRTNERQRINE